MSENQKPAGVPVDISRVKENARLLARWTGRPLSACQELTARAMDATSWQKLLTVPSFVPDELIKGQSELGEKDERPARIRAQASLLAGRLDIPAGTATKLAAFWQPTALKKTASVLFRLLEDVKAPLGETSLPATWLNRQPTTKELLKLASTFPALTSEEADGRLKKHPEAFFSMVRDGIAFHGMVGHELYLMAEKLGKRPADAHFIADVALGPGSIEPDGHGGFVLAKYVTQPRAALRGLTEQSANEVAQAFGLPVPGGLMGFLGGGVDFYGSQAALGLAFWFAKHPRKAAQVAGAANLYMGEWPENTMLRLEFELVHAGLLE